MGNSWRQLSSSSMMARPGSGSAGSEGSPDKVAHRQEQQPRRTGQQRHVKIGNPPGGDQHAGQSNNPRYARPDAQRSDLDEGASFARQAPAEGDVGQESHQPDKRSAKKSHADQKHKSGLLIPR